MAFTSIGLGQTCSSPTSPRWCARTTFKLSIKPSPKLVFFPTGFFGIRIVHLVPLYRNAVHPIKGLVGATTALWRLIQREIQIFLIGRSGHRCLPVVKVAIDASLIAGPLISHARVSGL